MQINGMHRGMVIAWQGLALEHACMVCSTCQARPEQHDVLACACIDINFRVNSSMTELDFSRAMGSISRWLLACMPFVHHHKCVWMFAMQARNRPVTIPKTPRFLKPAQNGNLKLIVPGEAIKVCMVPPAHLPC